MVDADEYYDGIPVAELPFTEIDVPDPVHLRRSRRYRGALDIDPVAAIEITADPQGLVARDPNSATGEAIRAIGYSPTARAGAGRGAHPRAAPAGRALARGHGLPGQPSATTRIHQQ